MTLDHNYDNSHFNFLISNWYSGATVLSILLNNHKLITCNGETFPFYDQNPNNLTCSCGNNLSECEFYNFAAKHFCANGKYDKTYFVHIPIIYQNKFLQRVFDSFLHLPKLRNTICDFTPDCRNKIDAFIKMHDKFFELACKFNNSSIYLDGAKSIRRVELFAKYGGRPIRIIHNVRDGRKFVASYTRNHNLDDKLMPDVAQRWIDYIHMLDVLKKRYPNIQVKEIRHEDLCADKASVVNEVCDFLGIENDPNIFNLNEVNYHLLGNDMRHKFDGTIIENNGWKKIYTEDTYNKVTKILEPYLKKYNYV